MWQVQKRLQYKYKVKNKGILYVAWFSLINNDFSRDYLYSCLIYPLSVNFYVRSPTRMLPPFLNLSAQKHASAAKFWSSFELKWYYDKSITSWIWCNQSILRVFIPIKTWHKYRATKLIFFVVYRNIIQSSWYWTYIYVKYHAISG